MPTDQESFWQSEFGDNYTLRNTSGTATNIALFSKILARTGRLESILEIGVNRGLNLEAIATVAPQIKLAGVEINPLAAGLARVRFPDVVLGSILDGNLSGRFDLVFTKGVLIHIDPTRLEYVYEQMDTLSNKYVLMAEYYSPTPVGVDYRGHSGKLFKRDFAGEFMTARGFVLVDYGFVYRHDPVFPGDDYTWFLMQRRA